MIRNLRTLTVFAAAALAAVTAPSFGAITMDIITAPTAGQPGFTTYTLQFTASEGLVGGFSGNLAGNNAFNGVLSQQLAAGVLPTPSNDFNAAIEEAGDSQFLLSTSQIIATIAPFESGTTLGGAFGIQAGSRTAIMQLVQIVAANDQTIAYNFGVSEAIGAEAPVFNFSGTLAIPEPASLGLLGLGGLALVARRRRA